MKLHTTKGAPSPARVLFFLAEKDMELEMVELNLMKGEHKTPEYRELSINGRVPALELDDGTVIAESVAICRYLEALKPHPPLFGESPLEQAQIEMWNRMMELEVFLPMAMTFRHTHPAMAALEQQISDYGEQQRNVANKRLGRLEKQLIGHDYIVGNSFSIADITAYCSLKFFKLAGFSVGEDQPNLGSWMQRIGERSAAQAASF